MKSIKNENQNSRWQRINLIANLISQSPKTISQLAEICNVSTKSIQRDLHEVLALNGATRQGRLWSMQNLNDTLSQDERMVLNILENISKSMGANFYSKAHVLLEQMTQQLNQNIITNINNEKLSDDDFRNFIELEKAIKQRLCIKCEYQGHKFKVKPLKLAIFDGFWYLLLLDFRGDVFKKFHLKSVSKIAILDENFAMSENLEAKITQIKSAWANLEAPKTARLLLAPQVAKYFKRRPSPRQRITGKDKDGSVEIELEYTHFMEIKPLVYYFIPFIKVLEPCELAREIRDEIGAYFGEIGG